MLFVTEAEQPGSRVHRLSRCSDNAHQQGAQLLHFTITTASRINHNNTHTESNSYKIWNS